MGRKSGTTKNRSHARGYFIRYTRLTTSKIKFNWKMDAPYEIPTKFWLQGWQNANKKRQRKTASLENIIQKQIKTKSLFRSSNERMVAEETEKADALVGRMGCYGYGGCLLGSQLKIHSSSDWVLPY